VRELVLIAAAGAAMLFGCSSPPASAPGAPSGPQAAAAPVPTLPPLPPGTAMTVRVMSYNVLWGGGIDRRFEANYLGWQRPLFAGRNRLADIVSVIEEARPDILAVEEAAGWEEGSPSPAEDLARRLGMHYYLARNPYEINTALFSRFEIESVLDLVPYFGSNSGLVAVLRLPDGSSLAVAAVHLDPFTSRMRSCQLDVLLEALKPFEGRRVLLLGDMNFRLPNAAEAAKLRDAGWGLLAVEETYRIDQVWARPAEGLQAEPLWTAATVPGREPLLSDHFPVGATVTVQGETADAPEIATPRTTCVPEPR